MKKVLIVSKSFPSIIGMGAVRVGKLAKYLPEFGWEPVVLTGVKEVDIPQALPVEIEEARVVRVPGSNIGASLRGRLTHFGIVSPEVIPEVSLLSRLVDKVIRSLRVLNELPIIGTLIQEPISWYFHGVKEGLKILNGANIDIIFSSSPPKASHFIASHLHKKTGIPWVAEYRDLWVNPFNNEEGYLYQFLDRKLEKVVMKGCSLLITASELTVDELMRVLAKRVVTIHNSFDEQDYLEDVPLTSKFTLTYTGHIYVGKLDPAPLFEAIVELLKEGRLSQDDFEVRFYGDSSLQNLLPIIEDYHLEKLVKICGYVLFKEIIRRQKESSALLLLQWNSPLARHHISGKLFEYLGARRPILATAYETGELDRVLQKTGAGVLVNEAKTMKEVLSCWLEEWRQSKEISSYWNSNLQTIRSYTRRKQAGKVAQMLNEVLASGTVK